MDDRIVYIITKYLDGKPLSAVERQQLNGWLSRSAHNEEVFSQLQDTSVVKDQIRLRESYEGNKASNFQRLLREIAASNEGAAIPVHRVHILKTAWFRYAAAVVIILLSAAYLWNYTQKERPVVAHVNPVPVKNDVAPGGNKALLTLSDGKTIVLDNAANGALASDGGAEITKSKSGEIAYDSRFTPHASRLLLNTMTTPRGGQYQITLSDGTKVWLNAESSITYPTAFAAKTREVTITGECYFEVAKDKTKPFVVKTPKENIEVLGTHFNVNAYADESGIKTSLLEGSVKIGNQILKPGQAYTNGKIIQTDVNQDVAWKNGIFHFNRTPMKDALRQLSRWYNVEVVYQGKAPETLVSGKMQRSLHLSQVLNILKGLEVKFRIDDRRLIVE